MITFEENEELIAVFRKHGFYITVKLAGLAVLAFLPLTLFPVLGLFIDSAVLPQVFRLLLAIYFAYMAVIWIVAFTAWTNYYLDMWLLTNKSLIDIEQKGLFYREVSTLRLDRIQDIKVEIIGLLDTLLHIGTVHVQTAGEKMEFTIRQVRNPTEVKEAISDAFHKQAEEIRTVKIGEGPTAATA